MLPDFPAKRLVSTALPRAVSLLLLLVVLGKGVELARAFAPPPAPTSAETPPAEAPGKVDLGAIRQAQLFGAADNATEKTVAGPASARAKSPLAVRLLGVVKAGLGNDSVAILAESGQQRAYSIGDELKANPGARLVGIDTHQILLEVAGERQTIDLEKTK